MTEDHLKAKINELKNELEAREQEVLEYLDRIEELEETVINLETLISDENSKASKKKWKKAKDSILEIELKEKEKQIRELKDNMGFLRKEKIQLQHELERYTKKESNSTVIRIEEKKEPFETLVKELQDKINKQQIIIAELQEEIKKEEIEKLKTKIVELNQKLEVATSPDELQEIELVFKDSPEELQKNLIKARKQNKILKNKLEKLKKKTKKQKKSREELISEKSIDTIDKLKAELKKKDDKIEELNNRILGLGTSQEHTSIHTEVNDPKSTTKSLAEELQRKLNKAKIEIKDLQKQLEDYKIWKAPTNGNSQDEIIRELRNKLERISTQDQALSELDKISNQIKHTPSEDPHLALRIKELKNLIKDLKTQNIQQRLEISKLRKK